MLRPAETQQKHRYLRRNRMQKFCRYSRPA